MFELYDTMPENQKDMRTTLCDTLLGLAKENEKIVYLDADLVSAIGMKRFFDQYPNRAINCGIQEANMMGVAAGLSRVGFVPFVHTFGTFATRRAYDQIFLSAGYANCPIKVIGSDPGVCASLNGGTHMPFEDVGIMRTMPLCTIVDPADVTSVAALIPQIAQLEGNVYFRMPRKSKEAIYKNVDDIHLGKANILFDGDDVTLIASGIMVREALKARIELQKIGISASVVDMHTIKPLDEDAIAYCARKTGAIVTCENHNKIGGLGSAVCEFVSESVLVPVERIAVNDQFGEVGPQEFLLSNFGLTSEDIVIKAKWAIARKNA